MVWPRAARRFLAWLWPSYGILQLGDMLVTVLEELRTRIAVLQAKVEAGNNTADQLIAGMVTLQSQVKKLQENGGLPDAAAEELLSVVNSTISSLDEQARQNAEALGLVPVEPHPEDEPPVTPPVEPAPPLPVPLEPPAEPPSEPPNSPVVFGRT